MGGGGGFKDTDRIELDIQIEKILVAFPAFFLFLSSFSAWQNWYNIHPW